MKYLKLVAVIVLFVCVLLLTYWIHVTFFKVNVVFYSALIDAVIASLVTFTLIKIIPQFNTFNLFESTQVFLIFLLLGYAFAISIPTVIDRSLSFYTLEKLQQRGGGIKLAAFEQVYAQEYMKEHRLVDVRLTEQEQSGTIMIKNGCVSLTEWGSTLATFSRYFRNHLLPKQRLLMGEYSSDLTVPFRASDSKVDYLCN